MTDNSKKIFLFSIIVGSFTLYSLIYYAQVFREAPYNFTEFKSFTIRYGNRNNMANYYNSATGEYDYLNKSDSLVKTKLFLTKVELDTLHTDASNLGFWDFPDSEVNNLPNQPGYGSAPRYVIEFNYKRRSKKVEFDANYNGPVKLSDANRIMIGDIEKVLSAAKERQSN
jgi:hypothetical protein